MRHERIVPKHRLEAGLVKGHEKSPDSAYGLELLGNYTGNHESLKLEIQSFSLPQTVPNDIRADVLKETRARIGVDVHVLGHECEVIRTAERLLQILRQRKFHGVPAVKVGGNNYHCDHECSAYQDDTDRQDGAEMRLGADGAAASAE